MNISKNKGLFFAAVFVVLAVYNVIVFVLPVGKGSGFWLGYGFSMLSIFLSAAVIYYTFDRKSLKSKVYGIPFVLLSVCYCIIQLFVGLIEIVLQFMPFQIGLVINVILLGAFLLGIIFVEVGKDEIERIDIKVKEKVFYIRTLQVLIEGLVSKAPDDAMKKTLNDLIDTVRYSDPMSSPQLAAVENKIEVKAMTLSETVDKNDWDTAKVLCNELQELLADRNRKCKVLK